MEEFNVTSLRIALEEVRADVLSQEGDDKEFVLGHIDAALKDIRAALEEAEEGDDIEFPMQHWPVVNTCVSARITELEEDDSADPRRVGWLREAMEILEEEKEDYIWDKAAENVEAESSSSSTVWLGYVVVVGLVFAVIYALTRG